MSFFRFLALFAAFAAISAYGQDAFPWDDGGNGQLNGAYHFREVVYVTGDASGALSRAISLYGTIEFDGNGAYSLSGSVVDSSATPLAAQPYTTTGTYIISAGGHGYLSSPVSDGDSVFGVVANGIFVGSSTEGAFSDLFVAAPAGSAEPTAAAFDGSYWVAHVDIPDHDVMLARSSLFALQADGAGSASAPDGVTGFISGGGESAVTQTIGAAPYTLANGVGTLSFPAGMPGPQTLIAGDKTFYISPDGNFVFGGAADGWDLLLGIRTEPGAAASFGGRYLQVGIDHDSTQAPDGPVVLDTYYGALTAANGRITGHQRVRFATDSGAFDFTYRDDYAVAEDGSYQPASSFDRFVVGVDGFARLGSLQGPYLGINIALKADEASGSGVFLNPAGVVNAGSFAPFTNAISPGEMITLFGNNLAGTTESAAATPLPTSVAGVEVHVNDQLAPVVSVSGTQVSAIVPYGIQGPVARFQVSNNGTLSNVATEFVNLTSPGAFTIPTDGLSGIAARHADFSPVDAAHPAQPGETISLYVAGLGEVEPAVDDGAAAPSSPLSEVLSLIEVRIDAQPAVITFAGLAPGFAGLYQLNVEVPAGAGAGDVGLSIAGPDSVTAQASLAVGPAAAALSPEADPEPGAAPRVRPLRSARPASSGVQQPRLPVFEWDRP